MRRQLSECVLKTLRQVRCTWHGRVAAICTGITRAPSQTDVDEINKELADLFGNPCPVEPSRAPDQGSQNTVEFLDAVSSSSSSNAADEPGALPRASNHGASETTLQQQPLLAEDSQSALEQLQQCTAQLQEQVRAMSRILQELTQDQQQQQQQQVQLHQPPQLHQHQELRINLPADRALFLSSQPSTPTAATPMPVGLQRQQQGQGQALHAPKAPHAAAQADCSSSTISAGSQGGASLAQERQQQLLTHVDSSGRASMVDVSHKGSSSRTALASCLVLLGQPAFDLVKNNALAKGDVLTLAQVAGIQGAKQTSCLIPLCHNIFLSKVDVQLRLVEQLHAVAISATAKTVGQTGVEMEALTAAAVAALTVYDMCKAVSKEIEIGELRLDHKEGGKSGTWVRDSSGSSSSGGGGGGGD